MPLHSARPFRKAIECTPPPFSPPTNGLGSLTLRNPSSGANAGQWKHLEYRQKLAGKFSTFLTLCAALLPQPPPLPCLCPDTRGAANPTRSPAHKNQNHPVPNEVRSRKRRGEGVTNIGRHLRLVAGVGLGEGRPHRLKLRSGGRRGPGVQGGEGQARGAPSPRPQVPAVSGPVEGMRRSVSASPPPGRSVVPVTHPGGGAVHSFISSGKVAWHLRGESQGVFPDWETPSMRSME